jgi:hypothetical protein
MPSFVNRAAPAPTGDWVVDAGLMEVSACA